MSFEEKLKFIFQDKNICELISEYVGPLNHIIFILDNSGSMEHNSESTINSFNSFLCEHYNNEKTVCTVVLFNSEYQILNDMKKIKDIPKLNKKTYIPGGMTSLYDTLSVIFDRYSNNLIPTICVIITDGEDTCSKTGCSLISDRIKSLENRWEFVYLGVGHDVFTETNKLNIKYVVGSNNTLEMPKLMRHVSRGLHEYLSSGSMECYFNLTRASSTRMSSDSVTTDINNIQQPILKRYKTSMY